MGRTDEVRSYWDRKIRAWDDSSYERERPRGLLGRLRSSVEARMRLALELLRPHIAGKTLLDLGCGTGRVAIEAVAAMGAASAHGIDVSPVAIARARALAQARGLGDRVTFEAGSVLGRDLPAADVTVGLGLLDWLTVAEIEQLLEALRGRRVLLSYSEQDGSLAEIIHRFYLVHWLRLVGGQVRAFHHRRGQILDLMARHGLAPCEIVAHPAARFGRLVHNLPGLG